MKIELWMSPFSNIPLVGFPTAQTLPSGVESMAKMAMLTITADDGAQGFRLRLRKSCARSW